ncbi:NrfD/PsrC family molybdoenzyme membrane anchor subunit [Novispirillum sp. DQ9]|uniref:NrfD/PsrC family molybdoenzyme membrane anchor subunit n=1 Tax=Novispirillum sp. DQ9 TaxID=3398612 RepID=UPI003C7AAF95
MTVTVQSALPDQAGQGSGASSLNTLILAISAIGFVVCVGFVLSTLGAQGHTAFNTNNDGMFWGLPIVVYDFFLLTSTGLAMTATVGLAMGLKDFAAIAKRCLWLALAGLAGGVLALFLELGHPFRALWAIPFSFQFQSPLYWKVLFVGAYVASLLVLLVKTSRPGWTIQSVRGTAIALLITALAVSMIAGSVFGMMVMRPFWFGGEIPVAFHVESMLGGLAFAVFFTYLAYGFDQSRMPARVQGLFRDRLPFAFSLIISLHAMFVGARTVSGLWTNADGLQVWDVIASSPLFYAEIFIGIALPLVLMLMPSMRAKGNVQILSAVLVMLALFAARYDFIIGGQMVAPFKGSWVDGLLSYTPSMTEWLLLLAAIFLANLVNAAGQRFLNLDQGPADV